MLRYLTGIVLVIAIGIFFTSQRSNIDDINTDYPSRRTIQQNAWYGSQSWLFIYNSTNPEYAEEYRLKLEVLQQQSRHSQSIQILGLSEITDSLLREHPVLLLGTDWPAHWYLELSKLPSLQVNASDFALGEERFSAKKDLLKLFHIPNPWKLSLPLHYISANTDEGLLSYLEDNGVGDGALRWSSWGYEVCQDSEISILGYFADSSWVVDKKVHFDFSTDPQMVLQTEMAAFWSCDQAEIAALLPKIGSQFEEQYVKIQQFCKGEDKPVISWYFYPSVERKALRTESMEESHVDFSAKEIHLVEHDNFSGLAWGKQYLLLLRHWLGKPKAEVLETGLAFSYVDNLYGHAPAYWASLIAQADALPSIATLVGTDFGEQQLNLVNHLSSIILVEFLLDKWGQEQFLNNYANWSPSNTKALDQEWKVWAINKYPSTKYPQEPYNGKTLKGFTLAHEGYRIFNGYGSTLARQSLEEMSDMGINAVAIVPYSYMHSPNQATVIPSVQHAGAENDEAVAFSNFSAQSFNQFTLLKPQVWIRGSWPGDVNFDTQQEWDEFFRHYEKWILHYAIVAEMYQFDGFCIGTELAQTTLKHPRRWRQMIRKIRKIYGGSLTYAANWGKEFEELVFWDEFDFIGLNSYYPLTKVEEPSPEDLAAGARTIMQKARVVSEKFDRPIWLTELGFRSATKAWRQPHEEAGDRAVDEAAQAACFDAMLSAVQENNDVVRGMFWWKWPSYLQHNESRGRGYMPYRKEAVKVMARYFQNWEN